MALSAESADQTNQNQSEPAAAISNQPSTTTTDAIKIKDEEEDDGDEEGVDVPSKPIDGTGGGEPGPSTISTSTTTSTNTKPKIENTTKELTRSIPSPCSTSPPPPDYHLIEFTLTHKQTMISLLNGCIPEVSPADSLEDTNQIYWRLGSLVHFFNIMFDTRTVLCIHDITPPMPSLRHMNQNKLQNINRYIRFWLEQFYYCDEVIDTLRFEPGHMAMTTILVLNLLNSVRHCLPQLRALFDAHWSPHLDSFTIELHSLVRFDQLNLLLQRALENERVAHQASKQGKKKLCEEVAELKANLEKSKAMVERLKVQVEKAKQQHPEPVSPPLPSPSSFQKLQKPGPSCSREPVSIMNPQLHQQPLLLQQHQQPPSVPTQQHQQQPPVPIHQQSQVLKSLLNHSSGSGTITITTTTGPCVSGGIPSSISAYPTGTGSTVLVSPLSKQQFPASTSILTLSPTGYSTNGMQPILSPRRRGRPRKNPYSPSPPKSHKPTAYKPIQSKPTQQQPITFTTNTSNYNNKMTPTLGMSTHHQSLIIPGSTARTILSTVPIGPGMGQTVMVGPQHSLLTPSNSILTTTSTQPNSNVTFGGEKSVLLKKVKFNGPQTAICTSSTNQLFITSNPMVSLVQNPMVSGPINLLSPTLTCQPTSFIVSQQQQQQQQQPMVSITLQPVPTSSQSLIAPPVSLSQPITLGQSVSMGQSVPMGQSVSLGQQSINMGNQQSISMGQPVTITQNQPVSLLTSVSTTQPSISSTSSGPSLLVKSEPLPDTTTSTATTTTGSKLASRPKRSSSSSIITPNSNLLSNIKISPSGASASEAVADQLNRNKNLLNKLYTAKYPDARQIDHDNLAMYYTQKSACSIKCRLCSKRFPSMASFRVHFQEHADQWVFHCNWEGCGAFFLSNYKLKRHKRTHTGERPFVCERCGKSYTRSDKLKEHTKQCTVKGSGGTNEELKEEVKESGGGSSSGSVVSDSGAPPSAPPSTSTGTLVTTLKRTKKGKTTNISVSNPPSPVMMTIYTQPNTTKPNPTKPNIVASSGGGTSVLAKIPNSKKKKVKKAKKDIKSLKFKIKCEQPFGSDSNNNNDNNDYVLKEPENEEPIPEFVKLGNGKRKKKVKGIRLALKLDEPEEPEWNGNDELSNLCFPDTGEGDEMKVDDNDNDDEAD